MDQDTAGIGKTAAAANAPVSAELLAEDACEPAGKNGFFRRAFSALTKKRYFYLFYAFIIPVILNYLIYLSMGLHPFGNGSVLVLDLNGQYVYFYEALRNAVYGETSLIYTFARSLGGEFFGIYAYYVASPFSYIVCLFPQDRMLEALLFIFLLKAGLSGVTMGFYLDRISSKLNKINVVTFSVLYSMCAYAVIQQHNSMWIDALMWLPLLTLGIEELIRNAKFKLYVTMLALTLLANFYIGYMVCIYTAVYFFYYYFSRNENGRNNPKGEHRHFLRTLLRMGFFTVIAVGISMVIVATAYYSLQFGKNTFSNPDFSLSIRFDFLDFFTKLLPGSYDTIRPEGLPIVYCGILTLYCVPVYFFSRKFSVREKLFAAGLIFFFIICFSVNTIDIIWHGFQKPNWLNYRYSFMFSFILVSLGYRGFGEIRKTSPKLIAAVAATVGILIAVAQKFNFHSYVDRIGGKVEFDQKLETLEIVWLSVICLVVFAFILFAAIRSKKKMQISFIMLFIVCIEAFSSGLICDAEFGEDVIYSSYSSYNDFVQALRPITESILENDESFYRFEKNVHRKYCDNSAFNIRGITNSTSTLNRSTIDFIAKLGYAGRSHWTKYLGGNPVNDSLIGIKYIIGTSDDNLDLYYDTVDFGTGTVNKKECETYLNPYALSLAYAVDNSVAGFDMKDSSPMLRLNRLLTSMTGSETDLQLFVPIDYEMNTENCTSSTIAGHDKYVHATEGKDASVVYTFTAPEDGEIFFYLPSDYAREVKIKVNGSNKGNFYASETTRIFSLGVFKKGASVTLTMTLDADVLYVKQNVDTLFYLDMEAVEAALGKLAEEQLQIDDGWKNTHFTGSVTTSRDDRMILTTLTYDKGWKITVDGEPVETYKALDALVAFDIPTAGTHRIEMVYRPTPLVLGAAVSIVSLVLFILVIILEKPLTSLEEHVWKQVPRELPDIDFDVDEEYRLYAEADPEMIDLYPSKPRAGTPEAKSGTGSGAPEPAEKPGSGTVAEAGDGKEDGKE